MDRARNMVQEINASEVEPEEVLADHPYYFDRKTGDIKMEW